MSGWTAKRFWKEATVEREAEGFGVRLDGRPVKTPAKAPLLVPTRALAEAVAAEWDAQREKIDPETMPVTRAANAAIDKVAAQFDEVAGLIAAYGGTDLLCYRAETPEELAARQAEAWDPLLDWAESALGAWLTPTAGVMHVAQSEPALGALSARVHRLDPFELTALHDLVGLSGSLVIGLAALEGWADAETLWALSRIDETWQEDLWGADEEAAETAARKKQQFRQALHFFELLKKTD
ncbi:ATP12 family protein [Actibacterium sp. MT2.3-13A]|uniref:ATP12 family chaperone protein n=1 Tax=Actibacterium sp. MT2.3-13A TaxID=2828332 RepID=UPI001BA6C633|nr:ATP12 family protein [Actibacterium sp. MT2.3-13A]